MYKNQLQELAQRSCFNLPSYSCIREGPDHAPRFKAVVSFNGEVFESPGYHTTLRQAEHAAAEVALTTLSRRGPTQSLAARILDETGVCKNLLQETAQRAGVSLPVYTTIRSGPRHLPLFTCVVEVGGRSFVGEPAKTKKQAEKNAALAAWSALKYLTPAPTLPLLLESSESMSFGTQRGREGQPSFRSSSSIQGPHNQRGKARSVNVRDRNRVCRDGISSTGARFYPSTQAPSSAAADSFVDGRYRFVHGSSSLPVSGEVSHDATQKFAYKLPPYAGSWHQQGGSGDSFTHGQSSRAFYNPQAMPGSFSSRRQIGGHHRRHSLSGMEPSALTSDAIALSQGTGGGGILARASPYSQQIRGLPYQSLSERFEISRPSLLDELQLKDDDDWAQQDIMSSSAQSHHLPVRRRPWQSQSERFEQRNHFLPLVEEAHGWDEEEWPPPESYCQVDTEQGLERNSNYKEGWLRGNTLLQILEAQKNHGYREGWLREEIKKQNLNEKRHVYKESWPDDEAPMFDLEKASCSSHASHNALNSIYQGDKERSLTFRDSFHDNQAETKSTLSASALPSSPSSPLSSLWAKSTQWWGSHRPSSPASAAAALASTLGLRPSSSMAPAVRVRQTVPVCAAPPPRRPDALASNQRAQADPHHLSSLADSEANVNQILSSLRL